MTFVPQLNLYSVFAGWGSEEIKRQTMDTEIAGTVFSRGKITASPKAQNIYYRVEQRNRVIAYSRARSRGYYIQINKKVRFLVYSWIKETGLANLCNRSVCFRTVLRL